MADMVAIMGHPAKTRMIKVKCNYKNMYKNNLNCRACGHPEESQDHILNQCHKIHTTDQSKIKPEEYFEEDPELLKKTAYKIETVMTLLESYSTSQASNQNIRRTNRTNTTRGASTPAPPSDGDETAQRSGCTH